MHVESRRPLHKELPLTPCMRKVIGKMPVKGKGTSRIR